MVRERNSKKIDVESMEDLRKKLIKARKTYATFRHNFAVNKEKNSAQASLLRKNIARILTKINRLKIKPTALNVKNKKGKRGR